MIAGQGSAPLAPTLDATAAAGRRWDVVVIGAGPAGAATAARLAAAGRAVLVVDRERFPRGKVCGCCLSGVAVAELAALGIDVQPAAIGSLPLAIVRLVVRDRDTLLGMPPGIVLSRDVLDATLLRHAIAAGCQWLPETIVGGCDVVGDGVEVRIRTAGLDAAMLGATTCVIATGLGDHVRIGTGMSVRRAALPRRGAGRNRIGLGAWLPADAADLPAEELVMAVARRGYCGLVRLEDGRLDLAAAVERRAVAAADGPRPALVGVLEEAGLARRMPRLVEALGTTSVRATPRLTHAAPLVAGGGRILRVGDAAAYVEPFTGEGIGWAVRAARILAEALLAADPDAVATTYAAGLARQVGPARRRCRGVALAVRLPRAVAAAGHVARLVPPLATRMVPWLVGSPSAVETPA